jgi:hypothetical protein
MTVVVAAAAAAAVVVVVVVVGGWGIARHRSNSKGKGSDK